jgi:hypothetical protein
MDSYYSKIVNALKDVNDRKSWLKLVQMAHPDKNPDVVDFATAVTKIIQGGITGNVSKNYKKSYKDEVLMKINALPGVAALPSAERQRREAALAAAAEAERQRQAQAAAAMRPPEDFYTGARAPAAAAAFFTGARAPAAFYTGARAPAAAAAGFTGARAPAAAAGFTGARAPAAAAAGFTGAWAPTMLETAQRQYGSSELWAKLFPESRARARSEADKAWKNKLAHNRIFRKHSHSYKRDNFGESEPEAPMRKHAFSSEFGGSSSPFGAALLGASIDRQKEIHDYVEAYIQYHKFGGREPTKPKNLTWEEKARISLQLSNNGIRVQLGGKRSCTRRKRRISRKRE